MRIRRGQPKEPEGSHTRESPHGEVVEERGATAFTRANFSGLAWSTTAPEDDSSDPRGSGRPIDLFAVREPSVARPERGERDVERIRRRKGVIMMALPVPKEQTDLSPLRNSPTPVWTPTRPREALQTQTQTLIVGSAATGTDSAGPAPELPTHGPPVSETAPQLPITPGPGSDTQATRCPEAAASESPRVSSPVQESPIEGLIAAILLHSEGTSGTSTSQ